MVVFVAVAVAVLYMIVADVVVVAVVVVVADSVHLRTDLLLCMTRPALIARIEKV